jgi:predicted nucleotidyltransferase
VSEPNLPAGFVAALRDLTQWLDAERAPYVLVGGVSVSLIAQPRATQDIDLTVWIEQERWENFLRAGESFGFAPRLDDALAFASASRVLLLRHRQSGVSVDLAFGSLEFEREMITRAATFEIAGLKLKLPTPEDLIITKAVAQRPKDIADIESVLAACESLDIDRVRRLTAEFAAALDAPEISDNLERLLHHHRLTDDRG